MSALRINVARLRTSLENEGCVTDTRYYPGGTHVMKIRNDKNYFEIECLCKDRKAYIEDWHNPIKETNHPVYEFSFFWSFKAGADFNRHDNLYFHNYKEAESAAISLTKINTADKLRKFIDETKQAMTK